MKIMLVMRWKIIGKLSIQRINTVIDDLVRASEKYPDEVSVAQTLGDAYMKANKLQEALDAYTKAQNLLK